MTANLILKPEEKTRRTAATTSAPYSVSWLAKLIRNLLWLPLSLVAVVVILEALFFVTHVGEEEFIAYEPLMGFRHMSGKLVTFRSEGFSQDRLSKVGMRDREFAVTKPAGVTRIAFVGDSLTEALQVGLKDTFVKRIERMLNGSLSSSLPGLSSTEDVEALRTRRRGSHRRKYHVMNFGCSGYGTVQEYLAFLTQARKYKPDVCIVCYSMTDVEENERPSDALNLPPRAYVKFDQHGRLQLDWKVVHYWFNTQRGKLFRRIDFLRQNSRVWGVIARRESILSVDKAWQAFTKVVGGPIDKLITASISGEPDLEFNSPTLAEIEGPGLDAPSVTPNGLLKRIEQCKLAGSSKETLEMQQIMIYHAQKMKFATALMSRMHNACSQIGSKFVVVGMPGFDSSLLYQKEFEVLKDQAKQEGFTFVDLHTPWPSSDKGNDPANWQMRYHGMHFNERGHEFAANTLYSKLVDAGVLPRVRKEHAR